MEFFCFFTSAVTLRKPFTLSLLFCLISTLKPSSFWKGHLRFLLCSEALRDLQLDAVSFCFQPLTTQCFPCQLLQWVLLGIRGVWPWCQTAHCLFISSATFGIVLFTEKMLSNYHFLFSFFLKIMC